jgi:hypothetical protein
MAGPTQSKWVEGPKMADLIVAPSPPAEWNSEPKACFVSPAPLIDVLFDQLEYLGSHTGEECPVGCPDCNRFAQVKKLLLVPFESPGTPEAPLMRPDSVSRVQTFASLCDRQARVE